MADGYIERRLAEYEKKKTEWIKKQKARGKKASSLSRNSATAFERHANDDM